MKVGITGGIGSGKTTISKVFEALNVPVYYADEASKKILNTLPVIEEIEKTLGLEILNEDGLVDRALLANVVFSDPNKLETLNMILHPAVRSDFSEWYELKIRTAPFVLQEAAILFETGSYKSFDKIVLVTADEELRIKRIIRRDKDTVENIKKRMARQWPDHEKMALADFVITNNNDSWVLDRCLEVYEALINLTNENTNSF